MNAVNNEQEYLVQKIRTQYTEKQHTESGNRKKLCKTVKSYELRRSSPKIGIAV